MGSDSAPTSFLFCHRSFQFTLPHGERPKATSASADNASFNSRSRMGSDHKALSDYVLGDVSIHAPAWGAT